MKANLREAEAIATPSRIRRCLAEFRLLHARFYTPHHLRLAHERFTQASALVADTGDHRRDAEILALARLLSTRPA